MPAPPETSVFTQYVLENPWPLAGILLTVAAILAWTGFREGMAKRLQASACLAIAGAALLAAGYLIETAGERARTVTRALVDSVVKKDLIAADALLANAAVLTLGSPNNAGVDKSEILRSLEDFAARYTIESNSISSEKAFTESSDAGVVHLSCTTTVQQAPYPTFSQWVVQVERQSNGEWQVTRLTCVTINNQTPSSSNVISGGR